MTKAMSSQIGMNRYTYEKVRVLVEIISGKAADCDTVKQSFVMFQD